jgi:hypothetical protein
MAGYTPASVLITNLPQAQATYFDRDFVVNLKANTPGLRMTRRRSLPAQSGNQHRLYMYQAFGANTSQASEGTVETGITPSVNTVSATIGQYADYSSLSDIALEVAIDPTLEKLEKEFAYRLALTINKLILNTADGANAIDSSVNGLSKAANTPVVLGDLIAAMQSLRGRSVLPLDQQRNEFGLIIHPFVIGDMLNDTTGHSPIDIYKYTVEGQQRIEELPGGVEGDEVQVLRLAGLQGFESNTVTTTANYQSSGKTGLRTYLFGYEAIEAISLGVRENAQIGEGDLRNMTVWINRYETPSVADMSRLIGGSVAYNVKFVPTLPCDSTMRLRYIDANTNIS